jgi:hypothetical protein
MRLLNVSTVHVLALWNGRLHPRWPSAVVVCLVTRAGLRGRQSIANHNTNNQASCE